MLPAGRQKADVFPQGSKRWTCISYILTIWMVRSIVCTTWWVTKPGRCPVMPARPAAVVPAGLRGRVAPVPHAGVEAAGARRRWRLKSLDGVRRRAAEVRRGIVSMFIHTDRCNVPGRRPETLSVFSSTCRSHMCLFCSPLYTLVTSGRTGST